MLADGFCFVLFCVPALFCSTEYCQCSVTLIVSFNGQPKVETRIKEKKPWVVFPSRQGICLLSNLKWGDTTARRIGAGVRVHGESPAMPDPSALCNPDVCPHLNCCDGWNGRIPGACWATGLAKTACSSLSERLCLKHTHTQLRERGGEKRRKKEEGRGGQY